MAGMWEGMKLTDISVLVGVSYGFISINQSINLLNEVASLSSYLKYVYEVVVKEVYVRHLISW